MKNAENPSRGDLRRTSAVPWRALLRDDRVQGAIITLFFAVGVAGHHYLPVWMEVLTPPVLWVYGLAVIGFALAGTTGDIRKGEDGASSAAARPGRPGRPRLKAAVWVVVTYLLTFTLEAVGTATGLVFGPYTYGGVLGVMVLAVPLVIGFNWVVVVLGAIRLTGSLPAWAAVPAAAAVTTAFDFLMEPAAIKLGYWTWHWDGIPPRNYLAWFLTSLIAAAAFRALRVRVPSRLPAYYLAIQAAFFVAIRVLN